MDFPTLETERLLLRVQRVEDFERFAEMMAHESARFIGGPSLRGDAWRRFLQMPGAWVLQGFGMFALIDKASGQYLGQAGPWYPEGWPGTEIGWSLHPDARGRGLVTEAALATVDYAFEALGWERVVHSIMSDNHASKRVAERLGSRYLQPVKMPPPLDTLDVELWGQTRDEWRARRRGASA